MSHNRQVPSSMSAAMIAPMSIGTAMCSPVTPSMANYTLPLLTIESYFDHCWTYTVYSYYWKLCYFIMAAYLAAIFVGRKYMASRPAFKLRRTLFLWNVVFAVYSTVSAWRMVPILTHTIWKYGLHASLCDMGPIEYRQIGGFWLFIFLLSKVVEFGDTAFIVLRKSPLIFLHWYHHVTVVFFVWSCGAYAAPMQFHFSTVNMAIHSIMYSYYALKVLGVQVPKLISVAITSLQLLQMVAGIFFTVYTYRAKAVDRTCQAADQAVNIAVFMYFSLLVLFLNFFIRSYVLKRRPKGLANGHVNGDVKKLD